MRVSATGPAAAEQAWDRWVTPSTWPHWAPHIRRVECADDRLRAGSTGTVHGPGPLALRFEVSHLDEATRSWTWVVGPVRLRMRHAVDSRPGGSSASMEVLGPVGWLLQPYRPLAFHALRRLTG